MRDSQRSRVYKSEWAVRFDHRQLNTLSECQAYVDDMRNDRILNSFHPIPKIEVVSGRGAAEANFNIFGGCTMKLPPWARTEFTIIHELAHFATPLGVADHGPEFVWIELQMLQRKFGKVEADEFRYWLSNYKVKVGKSHTTARKQRAPKHWTPDRLV